MFSLNYEFEFEDALYEYYFKELAKCNKNSIKEFEIEKKALRPKPEHDFLMCNFQTCSVSSYSLVQIDNNFYSVPEEYVGKEVIANTGSVYDERDILFL